MDATIKHALERKERIDRVEKTLVSINLDPNRVLIENDFVMLMCEEFGVSEKTSKEYIKIARYRINNGSKTRTDGLGEYEGDSSEADTGSSDTTGARGSDAVIESGEVKRVPDLEW